jgi:hypothetical protein
MATVNLSRRPDVVDAIAVLDGDKKEVLVQKTLRDGSPSQCLFFEEFTVDGCRIQLRLDWNDLDQNGDPTLDADISEGGEKLLVDRDKWHHTPKILDGSEWVYSWSFRGKQLRFKVQVTSQRDQTGVSRIASPADPAQE